MAAVALGAAGMTLADRLGTLRFYQNTGEPYAQLLREASKPALGMTAVSSYLGVSTKLAVLIGLTTVCGLILLAIGMGALVAKYHIYRAQIAAERDANPVTTQQLALLERIAMATEMSCERVRW